MFGSLLLMMRIASQCRRKEKMLCQQFYLDEKALTASPAPDHTHHVYSLKNPKTSCRTD